MAIDENLSGDTGADPRMARLQEIAKIVRIEAQEGEDADAFAKRIKSEIDALVNPLSEHRKALIALLNPAQPLDTKVTDWATSEVRSSLDKVLSALDEYVPKINALDPNFIDTQFMQKGFDLSQAEKTIQALNANTGTVGHHVRRDIRARTIFKGALQHIAFLLRSMQDGSIDETKARSDLEKQAELIRNLLSKRLALISDHSPDGWY